MAFWPLQNSERDEATANLRLTLFHERVNAGLPGPQKAYDGTRRQVMTLAIPSVPVMPVIGTTTLGDTFIEGQPFPSPDWLDTLPEKEPAFFGLHDLREVINHASYLTQEHGVWFNACIEWRLFQLGADNEDQARELMSAFTSDLEAQVAGWGLGSEASFAHMTRFEHVEEGFRATMALHLPRPTQADGIGTDCVVKACAWIRKQIADAATDNAITIEHAERQHTSAVAHHWQYVLRLCAGLAHDGASPSVREAFAALKHERAIPDRINLQVEGPLIMCSKLLRDDAVQTASRNRMEPLSAFDAEAWEWLRSGWEADEVELRQEMKKQRLEELRELEAKHGSDTVAITDALQRHAQRWPISPEHRQRWWRGWWAPTEV